MTTSRRLLVLSATVALVALTLLGCARATPVAVSTTTVSPSGATTETSNTSAEWRAQALDLARALWNVEDLIRPVPEPAPGTKPDGTFSAKIIGVDPASRSIILDRTEMFVDPTEMASAAKADRHTLGEFEDYYVRNRRRERLSVPVASDASFVVWYPGESALNVSPVGAAMSALTYDQFVSWFRDAASGSIKTVGAWVTVDGGRVISVVEPVHA